MSGRTAIACCLALALAPLLGCGGAEPPSGSYDESAEGANEAHYSVPAASELGPSATYAVTSRVDWKVEGNTASIRYWLPAELVGDEHQGVALKGFWNAEAKVFELAGTMGSARCRADATLLHCDEQLPGIHVDLAAVQKRIASAPDGATRLEVSRRFIGDPIGVLEVRSASRAGDAR